MEDLKCVLDVGNGYIKGVIFGMEDNKKIVLAKDMVKTQGMRKGRIIDVNEFGKSILSVVEGFEKKLGEGVIESVILGVSHPKMLIKRIVEQKRLIGGVVEEDDISHFDKIISEFNEEPNYEIIKTIPVIWIIDDEIKVKDPLGMQGKKLEMIADVFMLPKNFYNSLIETFENIGLDFEDIVPNILGASEVALDVELKDLGCCLIDIGTNQTTFVVYEDMQPMVYGVIPYGGEDVTKDISIGLQVDIKEAEKIKREKGIIIFNEEVKEDDQIDIKFLSEIIAARYEDIFDRVKKVLQDIGRDGKLAGGIHLIGGGAKMKNLDLLGKEFFKLPVFYGKDRVLKIGDLSNNLQFVNVIGDYVWFEKYGDEFTSGGLKIRLSFAWLGKIWEFIKKAF